jgi:hypothetical protein
MAGLGREHEAVAGVDGRAGALEGVAGGVARAVGGGRGPGADVVPGELSLDHEDAGGFLHHAVVY